MTITHVVTEQTTWKKIAEAIRSGNAKESFNVGDIITVDLKDGVTMRIAVAGINTYVENEVVFAFKDILPEEHYMNEHYTNEGGYEASDMAAYLDTDIFALLPDDLQEVIKERRGHKLWLFSRREVFGEDGRYICPDEDVHLPYYKETENRVKLRNGESDWWWLASPSAPNTTYFANVSGNGHSYLSYAGNSSGVAPGFCI